MDWSGWVLRVIQNLHIFFVLFDISAILFNTLRVVLAFDCHCNNYVDGLNVIQKDNAVTQQSCCSCFRNIEDYCVYCKCTTREYLNISYNTLNWNYAQITKHESSEHTENITCRICNAHAIFPSTPLETYARESLMLMLLTSENVCALLFNHISDTTKRQKDGSRMMVVFTYVLLYVWEFVWCNYNEHNTTCFWCNHNAIFGLRYSGCDFTTRRHLFVSLHNLLAHQTNTAFL